MKFRHAVLVVIIAWLPYLFFLLAAFDKDKPAASTSLRSSNPELLANFAALETAIDQDHDFTTGGTQTGKHNKLTLMEEASDITTTANEMGFYCKDLGAAPGIYVRPQSNGTAIQWTGTDAKILSAATDMLDEDNMASDSATKAASQQSIKAYVDSGTVTMTNKTLTSPTITGATMSGGFTVDQDTDIGAYELRAQTFESDVTTGTAPFTIASTTVSTNLNADMVDGEHIDSAFGVWNDRDGDGSADTVVDDTVYEAASDGWVVVRTSTYSAIDCCTDENNPPTTVVTSSNASSNEQDGTMFPVKKGHFWRVTTPTGSATVYWMPIGN